MEIILFLGFVIVIMFLVSINGYVRKIYNQVHFLSRPIIANIYIDKDGNITQKDIST